MKYLSIITLILSSFYTSLFAQELPPVSDDEVDIVEKLPIHYPDSWIYVSKTGFPTDGRIMIVDVADKTKPYKGAASTGYLGDFAVNNELGEFYVSETFYSRASRGKRSDMITIFDQATLMPKGEIALEEGKRFLVLPMKGKFRLINNKKWAMVANYTPAASVTIVDLENKKLLNEIPIPGCNLAFPLGNRGFATLCGYGEVISVNLDENGQSIAEHQSDVFNDLDNDPHFEKFTRVGEVMYLPTYEGNITPIDLSGDQAKVGETWSLVSDAEREQGWRPGGWQVITSDSSGNLYVLMHDKGYNGSHKDPGKEVWVFDPKSNSRTARHTLNDVAWSILVTKEKEPHLVTVMMDDENLNVYDAASGDFIRKIKVGTFVPTLYTSE
ncbi:MAG: amine dehydrogenase [Kordiimonadaceae bacterium]|jgi:methylamine dehydrogenase heavy chain|nr:amine dehydrogenase [Gammaproteobacteria bacterium]MBT5074412.1 amine dehydrogenase [Kordiimonadaceae bacterium]MBT6035066.1 amine dehydrogenase [Kordiimonadaceae bacterium]MBT6330340.1 amine dehydrogenase [Kordiimonadaceae bacterium]